MIKDIVTKDLRFIDNKIKKMISNLIDGVGKVPYQLNSISKTILKILGLILLFIASGAYGGICLMLIILHPFIAFIEFSFILLILLDILCNSKEFKKEYERDILSAVGVLFICRIWSKILHR